jgi:hypothetical protein
MNSPLSEWQSFFVIMRPARRFLEFVVMTLIANRAPSIAGNRHFTTKTKRKLTIAPHRRSAAT